MSYAPALERTTYVPAIAARSDAYDFDQRSQPPDQTPVRPGPWYHASPRQLSPGDILDASYENNYGYHGDQSPRDSWVFVHPTQSWTEHYGDHVYEVEPLGEGPYAYNGDEGPHSVTGYVTPKARVVRELTQNRPQYSTDFADAMAMMAAYRPAITAAVPGVIHRGITIDLDSNDSNMAELREILKTKGAESPEFVSALQRHTGTYWTRDKGFAERVNPGQDRNGIQVAMSADWRGNGAQALHPENTRNLPDSWGDMSLLAPAENPFGEFNIKPGVDLNLHSVRVRKPGETAFREVLRSPVRARTAKRGFILLAKPLTREDVYYQASWHTAEPHDEAYDPGDYAGEPQPQVKPGPWWHASDRQYGVGDVIVPNKGYYPSSYNGYYDKHGLGDRQNWVWMDDPEEVRNHWGKDNWVYEVEPLDEGPWPFNGEDLNVGYVAPRARVKKVIKQKTAPPPRWQSPVNIQQRLVGPRPADPNEDYEHIDKAAMMLALTPIPILAAGVRGGFS